MSCKDNNTGTLGIFLCFVNITRSDNQRRFLNLRHMNPLDGVDILQKI